MYKPQHPTSDPKHAAYLAAPVVRHGPLRDPKWPDDYMFRRIRVPKHLEDQAAFDYFCASGERRSFAALRHHTKRYDKKLTGAMWPPAKLGHFKGH